MLTLSPFLASAQTVVTATAPDAQASEIGPDTGTFRLTRSGSGLAAPLMVKVRLLGSALSFITNAPDYTVNQPSTPGGFGSLDFTIPAGQANLDIVLTPTADSRAEGDEVATLTVGRLGSTYEIGDPAEAAITITDSASTVSVTAPDPNASERPETGTFRLSRNGNLSQPIDVVVRFSGTAFPFSARPDFIMTPTPARGSFGTAIFSFGAGEATLDIVVTPTRDDPVEGDEVATLIVGDDSAYRVGTPSEASIMIADFINRIFIGSFE